MKNPSFTDKILSFLSLLLHDLLLLSSFLISQPLILAYLILLFPYLLKLLFFLFPLLFSTFLLLLALLTVTFHLHESPSSSAVLNFIRAELVADDANGGFIEQLCSMVFVDLQHCSYQIEPNEDCNSGNQSEKIVVFSQSCNLFEDSTTKKNRTEILSEKTEEKSCSVQHRPLEEKESNSKNMVFVDSQHCSYQIEPNEDCNSGKQSEKIVALSQSCNIFEDSTTKKNRTEILSQKTEQKSCSAQHRPLEEKESITKNMVFVDSQHCSYQMEPNEDCNSANQGEKIVALSQSYNLFEDSKAKNNKTEILSEKTEQKSCSDQQKPLEEKESNNKTILQRRNEHSRRPSEIFQREGSIKKEKEWKRTLACKLFEERMTYKLCEERKVVNGAEEMDLLWEAYEADADKTENQRKEKNTEKAVKVKMEEEEEEEEEEEYEEGGISGQLCCLQALKLSAGKMNLGMGRPSLVKISMALKGMAVFHRAGRRRKITN